MTGTDGADGAIGAQGPIGLTGADGATGSQGPIGLTGADGADGATGSQGPIGLTGQAGADGANGATGPQGVAGPAGPQGPAGADGAVGPQGVAGSDGATGAAGADGIDGATGPQGPIGLTGVTGDKGDTGATGSQGTAGPAGVDGADGADGLAGADGSQGIQGIQGPAGADGADGINGAQGPQGEPGTSSWFDGFETVTTFGSVQIGNDTAVCSSANEGTIRYNTTSKTLELCNGSEWVTINVTSTGSGGGGGGGGGGGAFACGVDQVVQDADGNLYDTVLIGSQCWMAENLNVGTMIAGTTDMLNNTVIEKYCFNNDTNICATDGGLYQWNEMMQYSTTEGVQGICPTGWHLPTDTEWKTLEMALGMTQAQANSTSWRGTDQGTQLKQGGSSGFQALLAGLRYPDGSFLNRGTSALFWSSTESGSSAWYRILFSNEARVLRITSLRHSAFPCVALRINPTICLFDYLRLSVGSWQKTARNREILRWISCAGAVL